MMNILLGVGCVVFAGLGCFAILWGVDRGFGWLSKKFPGYW